MKKLFLWLMVLVIGISLIAAISLFGCKEEAVVEEEAEEAQGEPIELQYWTYQQSEAKIDEINSVAIDEFEKMNPNVKIKLNVIPYEEYRDKLLVSVQGGNPPDISAVDQIWNSEFAMSGAILPLDDYLKDSDMISKDIFFEGCWDSCVYDGQVWGIPIDADVWYYNFYNKDMFEAAGLDAEEPPIIKWSDLLDSAEKLTTDGQWAVGLQAGKDEATICIIDSYIYSNGGTVISEDGRTSTINSPEVIEALKFYKALDDYAPEGTISRTQTDTTQLFTEQKAAIFWFPQLIQDTLVNYPDLNWGMTVCSANGDHDPVGTLGGWNLVIYKDAPNKDMAFKFIEFLTSKDVNLKTASLLPANVEAAEEFAKDRVGPDLIIEGIAKAKPRPISPVYPQISEVQQDMLQEIFSGTSVEEAVESANVEIQAILDELYQ
jgi:multiple sugar transport system substrate-binding protein